MKNLRSNFMVHSGYMFPGTGMLGRKVGVGWVCYVQLYEADSGLCKATTVTISTSLQREDPSQNRFSVPFCCHRRRLKSAFPLNEIAKTEVLCPRRCGTIKILSCTKPQMLELSSPLPSMTTTSYRGNIFKYTINQYITCSIRCEKGNVDLLTMRKAPPIISIF